MATVAWVNTIDVAVTTKGYSTITVQGVTETSPWNQIALQQQSFEGGVMTLLFVGEPNGAQQQIPACATASMRIEYSVTKVIVNAANNSIEKNTAVT
jgi:hypothetical protein